MAFTNSLSFVLAFLMWLAPQTATTQNTDPATDATAKANTAAPPANAPSMDEIIDRAITKEQALVSTLANYTPMVETYIQNLTPDKKLGAVPVTDRYFLGKLDLKNGVN